MKMALPYALSMIATATACADLTDAPAASTLADDISTLAAANSTPADSAPTISALTSSPARPAAVGATFAGFSYHTNGVIKEGPGFATAIVDVMDYNTFTSASYNIATGTFTAPMAGYYRFSTYGFSPTMSPATDSRVGVGITLNGSTDAHIVAVAGGQLSRVDSPMPSLSHVMHLNVGDQVNVRVYSEIQIALGAGTFGVGRYYFQGEFLGQ